MSKENNLNHSVYPLVITLYYETQTLLLQLNMQLTKQIYVSFHKKILIFIFVIFI